MWKSKIIVSVTFLFVAVCYAHGQALFTDGERQALGETFASYLEQMVDTMSKMKDENAIRMCKRKNFYFFQNGKDVTSPCTVARQLYSFKTKKYKLYLSKTDKLISCRWVVAGSEIKVVAEISREAIEGTDKEQADKQVTASLKCLPKADYTLPLPQSKELSHIPETSMLVKKGKTYMLKGVDANTYYRREGGIVKTVFTKDFPIESIQNLTLNALPDNSYRLAVTPNIYGDTPETVEVSLKDLIAYWQSKGVFNLYCGVSKEKDSDLFKVSVFVEHRDLQYIHLLRFTFPETAFDNPNTPLKALLTPNIPQHNLKSILD